MGTLPGYVHSQGAAQVRLALGDYPEERKNRIIIAAIAPFAYIPSELCMKVTHYTCPSDRIAMNDKEGRRACVDTITYVPKTPKCKQSCHEFLNPIYLPYIQQEIDKYQELLKEYVE